MSPDHYYYTRWKDGKLFKEGRQIWWNKEDPLFLYMEKAEKVEKFMFFINICYRK